MFFLKREMPPLASLLPFEAAARLGSITRAADELGLTQAAVSRQIKALETDLNTRLFDRRNRRIFLTEAGLQFSQAVSESLNRIGSEAVQLRRQRSEGEVVLFSQQCEGLYWLMPRLSHFYQTHPDIEVRIMVSTLPFTESAAEFDLALQTSGRASGDSERVYFTSDVIFPICSPAYLERTSHPVTFATICDHRLLHLKTDFHDWMGWPEWLQRAGSSRQADNPGSVFDNFPMMMQAALEGHGIGLGWFRTTEKFLVDGELIRPVRESVRLTDALSIYLPRNQPPRSKTLRLLDWLKREFETQQYR